MRRVLVNVARAAGLLLLASVSVLSILAVAPQGALAQAPAAVFPVTGFGGYNVGEAAVGQISASWRVPKILASSRPGYASTWIGAQNETTGSPFIQLGTIENKIAPGDTSYEAFWSDVAVGFRPQFFAAVGPGQLVAVQMVRRPSGWMLMMDVGKLDTSTTKVIDYGVGQSFTQAEWLQEDPAPSSVTAVDEPYPELAPVVFTHLEVNGRRPHLSRSDGVTLTAQGGVYLVPTAVSHGSFSLDPPKGQAKTYLVLAGRLDHAASVYDVQLAKWDALSLRAREAAAHSLAVAFTQNATQFVSHTWPRGSRHLVTLLVRQLRQLVVDIHRWSAAGLSLSGPTYQHLARAEDVTPVADRLRNSLGLPPP